MLKKQLSLIVFTTLNAAALDFAYANGHGGAHGSGRNLGGVIVLLGILTLACLLSTFILGILMPKKRKILFSWHKKLGIVTVIAAILHGMMVLFFH